jgi:hypothetical protein
MLWCWRDRRRYAALESGLSRSLVKPFGLDTVAGKIGLTLGGRVVCVGDDPCSCHSCWPRMQSMWRIIPGCQPGGAARCGGPGRAAVSAEVPVVVVADVGPAWTVLHSGEPPPKLRRELSAWNPYRLDYRSLPEAKCGPRLVSQPRSGA